MQPPGKQVCHLLVIQVGEGEMGVAVQSGFGQVYDSGIPAVAVHAFRPLTCQKEA